MGLDTVEIFLLIAVFAPLLTGAALVDLLDRVDAPLDVASLAASWAMVMICLPVLGPALWFAVGRDQVDADLAGASATVITGSHPIITVSHPVITGSHPIITGSHPVVV